MDTAAPNLTRILQTEPLASTETEVSLEEVIQRAFAEATEIAMREIARIPETFTRSRALHRRACLLTASALETLADRLDAARDEIARTGRFSGQKD